MLVEEIDRLHIELWHARMQASERVPPATEQAVEAAEVDEEPVTSSLHGRLQKVLRRDRRPDPVAEPAPRPEEAAPESAQAWIAALRRQK
jgi:hypothetical protein